MPPFRRRLQAAAIFSFAILLLFVSVIFTSFSILIWHLLTTRPNHTLPLYFSRTNTTPAKLSSYTSLTRHPLRSVAHLTATVQLDLPESDTNLQNSVFHISSTLLSIPRSPSHSEPICLSQATVQATLNFRSAVHRAIRAVSLFIPLLFGFVREYQTVEAGLLSYRAVANTDGQLPRLEGVRVEIWPAEVQIAKATLKLRVERRSFVGMMVGEGRVSTFLVVTLGGWYVMLVGMCGIVACVSAVRVGVRTVWQWGWGNQVVAEKKAGSETAIRGRDAKLQQAYVENREEGGQAKKGRKDGVLGVSANLPPRFGEERNSPRRVERVGAGGSVVDLELRKR